MKLQFRGCRIKVREQDFEVDEDPMDGTADIDLWLLQAGGPREPPNCTDSVLHTCGRLLVSRRHAARGAGLFVIVCLATFATDIAGSGAQTTSNGAGGLTASSEITCARDTWFQAPPAALAAGGRRTASVSIDGVTADLPIWKTITIGTDVSARALRDDLKAARCGVGDLAAEVLDRPGFPVAQTKTPIDLVVLSAADLGIEAENVSLATIYSRAAELGLHLCPAEVAPQLRLQYRDQPIGEFLHIAMEPVVTDDGAIVDLIVANGGAGLLLIGGETSRDRLVHSSTRFVFTRPRPLTGPRPAVPSARPWTRDADRPATAA